MNALPLIALQQLRDIGPKKTLHFAEEAFKKKDPLPDNRDEFCDFVPKHSDHLLLGIGRDEAGRAWDKAKKVVEACEPFDISPIAVYAENYPTRLRDIHDKPPVLYVKGSLDALQHDSTVVAIIGTRMPTPHGAKEAHRLGKIAATHNIPVVSGLADGCDFQGHRGCLDGNGTTIAVLAHGLDTIYPRKHNKLARQIEARGCLVSEHPPGTPIYKWNFPKRNRLQSALSDIVIVVQAGSKSGTMHTVGFAEKQKKDLVCLRPIEEDQNAYNVQGNLNLIKKNRCTDIIECAEDLPRLLGITTENEPDSSVPPENTASDMSPSEKSDGTANGSP